MILIDTNALLALVVTDRAMHSEAVLAALDDASERGEAVVVSESVMVEACTVLCRDYGLKRRDIAEALAELLAPAPLTLWDARLASHALDLMRVTPALSITDCLLTARAEQQGAAILTFDRKLQRALGVE